MAAVTEGILEIDRLCKRYGDIEALRELSFEVRPGELFGFVGANGAGKTTTMRIILGVLAADSGEVRWAGKPLTYEGRSHIGYMAEERGLYPRMKVLEQLVYLGQLHGMSAGQARAAATEWLSRLGLGERLGDELQKLSHGNQQRAQLAAALVFSPRMLVLDEPFAGLDPLAVDLMAGALRKQAEGGVIVIFSSHQLELVERLCDRVGIIRDGQMVANGTVDELRSGGARRLWVDVPSAGPDWVAGLPEVRVVRTDASRLLLEVDGNDQAVLQAALRAGAVKEFSPDRPTLTELFRAVVAGKEQE
jgi:ABC-2 type transport system ATP-binding protein